MSVFLILRLACDLPTIEELCWRRWVCVLFLVALMFCVVLLGEMDKENEEFRGGR